MIRPRQIYEGKRRGQVIRTRREGSFGVKAWDGQSTTVISMGTIHNGPWQVADPRLAPTHRLRRRGKTWRLHGTPLDPTKRNSAGAVIQAPDGTCHRPMTVLELAALQGLPTKIRGEWLHFSDDARYAGPDRTVKGRDGWRLGIGNAVPPPAARAIARSCAASLAAARTSGVLELPGTVWVTPRTSFRPTAIH